MRLLRKSSMAIAKKGKSDLGLLKKEVVETDRGYDKNGYRQRQKRETLLQIYKWCLDNMHVYGLGLLRWCCLFFFFCCCFFFGFRFGFSYSKYILVVKNRSLPYIRFYADLHVLYLLCLMLLFISVCTSPVQRCFLSQSGCFYHYFINGRSTMLSRSLGFSFKVHNTCRWSKSSYFSSRSATKVRLIFSPYAKTYL